MKGTDEMTEVVKPRAVTGIRYRSTLHKKMFRFGNPSCDNVLIDCGAGLCLENFT